MDNEIKPAEVANDVVVSMEYTLTVDGAIVDSSDEDGPLEFLQGHGNIISGLEKALYGMKTGENKRVVVGPAEGYGDYDPKAVMDVPRREFPREIPLKPGVELEVTDQDGDTQFARIVSVGKDEVKLDFNHPLAGKTLHFEITIGDLRIASSEELAHGHVHAHGHGHSHGDDEEEDFYLDDADEEDLDEDEDLLYEDIEDDDYYDEDEFDDEDED